MNRIFLVVIALVLGSCAAKHPLGFSQGNAWTIPLMGATGEGLPVTPVYINGKGPYLFFVSVDSETTIDPELATKLDLWRNTSRSTKLVNSKDNISHEQIHFFDVPRLSAGDLTVTGRTIIGLPTRATYRGLPILGILGRDIVGQSSLIWSLDRDRQILRVATQGHYTPPADARPVPTVTRYGKTFVKARIDDAITAELQVSIYGMTAIWPELAAKAGLPEVAGGAWLAREIEVGNMAVDNQVVLPFRDQRVDEVDYGGTLGRGVWSQFNVAMNQHENRIWLEPRMTDPTRRVDERLQRWGDRWAGCDTPACVTVEIVEAPAPGGEVPGGEASAPGGAGAAGRSLVITRAASHTDENYDVLLTALDAQGRAMDLPGIVVAMPPGFTSLRLPVMSADGAYASAARFVVTDATPVPPPCNSPQGCFWLQN